MSILADLIELIRLGYGWIFATLLLLYELYAPKWIDRDTALAPLVRDLPNDFAEVKEEQKEIKTDVSDVQNHVQEVQERQTVQMQVQRAQARATDHMDESQVDRYLQKNGVTVGTFLTDRKAEEESWVDEENEE